jgi:hypothetical protein
VHLLRSVLLPVYFERQTKRQKNVQRLSRHSQTSHTNIAPLQKQSTVSLRRTNLYIAVRTDRSSTDRSSTDRSSTDRSHSLRHHLTHHLFCQNWADPISVRSIPGGYRRLSVHLQTRSPSLLFCTTNERGKKVQRLSS